MTMAGEEGDRVEQLLHNIPLAAVLEHDWNNVPMRYIEILLAKARAMPSLVQAAVAIVRVVRWALRQTGPRMSEQDATRLVQIARRYHCSLNDLGESPWVLGLWLRIDPEIDVESASTLDDWQLMDVFRECCSGGSSDPADCVRLRPAKCGTGCVLSYARQRVCDKHDQQWIKVQERLCEFPHRYLTPYHQLVLERFGHPGKIVLQF